MLRLLTPDDLPSLLHLKEAAGWNQTASDWLHILCLEPLGCFGIEADGMIRASAVCIRYGSDLAWIGMVLTAPEFRGRGFARRLLDRCLDHAGSRPTRLDATDLGRPLYTTLGFRDEYPVERWRRPPGPPIPATDNTDALRIDPVLDREAFGADRQALLQAWQGASANGSFALWRPGANSAYFGPCVAVHQEDVAALANRFLALHGTEPCFWDLFDHARDLARDRGFQPARRLVRMVRNATPERRPDGRIWAIAGFEFG